MILNINIHFDALFLKASNMCFRAGGYFPLGSLPKDSETIKNRNILITCSIFKLVAASAAEAKLGVLFLNAQESKVI